VSFKNVNKPIVDNELSNGWMDGWAMDIYARH